MRLLLLVFSIVLFSSFHSDKSRFERQFQSEITWANQFLLKNKKKINHYCSEYQIQSKLFCSIIFPELIRYRELQNFFETKSLELSYLQNGLNQIDFSIGYFQIKPSFAEKMEALASDENNENWSADHHEICSYGSIINEKDKRKARLDRLKQIDWQIKYVCFFIKYCEKKWPVESADKISAFATRFNSGVDLKVSMIKYFLNKKYFPHGMKFPSAYQYNYAQISTMYFQNSFSH